jgi:hypothetical protein
MPRIVTMISLLGLLAILATAHADECFCLTHTSSGAILRGCEAKGALLLCTDPFTAKKSVQQISPDWKRVEAGADLCGVCRGSPRDLSREPFGERPRGNDDVEK